MVEARDLPHGLAAADLVHHVRDPLAARERGQPFARRGTLPDRHAHPDAAPRRRHPPHQVRVQVLERRLRGVAEAGQDVEPHRIAHHERIVDQGRERRDAGEAVPLRLLGDDGGGDELGDVVAGLTAEVRLRREGEELEATLAALGEELRAKTQVVGELELEQAESTQRGYAIETDVRNNRERSAAITREIIEVVSGAEAL